MPSPKKSTRTESAPVLEGPDPRDLALLSAPERNLARAKTLELVTLYRQAGRELPEQTRQYAVALGVLTTPAEAHRIAEQLLPDLEPDQVAKIASTKERIGRLAAILSVARAEVRSIQSSLHGGRSGKAGEPPFLECRDAEQVAKLRPGRRHLDLAGALHGAGPGWIFTSPGDDLAAELFWATEAEDQLAEMETRLAALAKRDEAAELEQRRTLLAGRLSQAEPAERKATAA